MVFCLLERLTDMDGGKRLMEAKPGLVAGLGEKDEGRRSLFHTHSVPIC